METNKISEKGEPLFWCSACENWFPEIHITCSRRGIVEHFEKTIDYKILVKRAEGYKQ